jgi:hypothetical protein
MTPDEEEQTQDLIRYGYRLNVCPNCLAPIPKRGGGYGSGRLADGLFCSLKCFGDFWYAESRRLR